MRILKNQPYGFIWMFLLLWTSGSLWAQTNLVYDGSFEAVPGCQPHMQAAYNSNTYWEKPVGSTATPDILQKGCANITCAFNDQDCSGGTGNKREKRTPGFDPSEGWKFGGLILYHSSQLYREYVSIKLSSPMEQGRCYRFSFKVRNGRGLLPYNYMFPVSLAPRANLFRKYYSNNMGAYFSANKPVQQNGNELINATPQVNVSTVINANAVWEEYVFYICAEGGEEWLTMGNFFSDTQTQLYDYNEGGNCGWGRNAYYCLDEIKLYDLRSFDRLIENTNYSSGTVKTEQNFQNITAGYSVDPNQTNGNVVVNTGANVTYKAMSRVTLKPGFNAKSRFHAYIDPNTPCGPDCQPIDGKWEGNAEELEEIDQEKPDIQVFPNPNNGFFEVSGVKGGRVIITDYSGKLLKNMEVERDVGNIQIDLKDKPNGIYLIRVEHKGELFQSKIVKQ